MYRKVNTQHVMDPQQDRGAALLTVKSPFQTIEFEQTKGGLALFLNDEIQFSERYERGYHQALAGTAIEQKPHASNILVLGGGDGLAARTLYEHNHRVNVHLAELDPVMVEVCSKYAPMARLNKNALQKTIFYPGDAKRTIGLFPNASMDVVLVDFPDKTLDSMGLYEASIYDDINRVLKPNGVLSAYPGDDESNLFNLIKARFGKVRMREIGICEGLVCGIIQGVKTCLY